MARQLWAGGYVESMAALREANRALHEVLTTQVANQHDRRASAEHLATKDRLVDGVLLCIARAQSKFNMPLVTAALSILAETNQVPREFWTAIRVFFHGCVAVGSWVDGLLTIARDLRPPPSYEQLRGVAVGVFDHLTMKTQYGSYMRDGFSGTRMDMTNWFWCDLPAALARPGFDAHRLASSASFFRTDRSISRFCFRFYLDCTDIQRTVRPGGQNGSGPFKMECTWRGPACGQGGLDFRTKCTSRPWPVPWGGRRSSCLPPSQAPWATPWPPRWVWGCTLCYLLQASYKVTGGGEQLSCYLLRTSADFSVPRARLCRVFFLIT